MTPNDCLSDELEYLKDLLLFFEKIQYLPVLGKIRNRITIVENKIKSLQPETETIF